MSSNSSSGASRLVRWALGLGLGLVVVAALGVYFGRQWAWNEIRRQAAEQGVSLSSCDLDLGLREVVLGRCQFKSIESAGGRAHGSAWLVPGLSFEGRFDRAEVRLVGLTPLRMRIIGVDAAVTGRPGLADLLGKRTGAAAMPFAIEGARVRWSPEPGAPELVVLSDLQFESASRQGRALFEAGARARGQIELGDGRFTLTVGAEDRPRLRLTAGAEPGERARVDLDLHRFPARELEGPWLKLTDALRSVELDLELRVGVPLGMSTDPAAGDVHMTLHGLSFPVPREVEGLVHGEPPTIFGAFTLNRALNAASFTELTFTTGSLVMRGSATAKLEDVRLALEAGLRGPLPCTALAAAAITAHSQSPLARWATQVSRSALVGTVDIIVAVRGRTPQLDQAELLTSIETGCGLEPLPIPEPLKGVLDGLSAAILPHLRLRVEQPTKPGAAPRVVVPKLPPLPPLPKLPQLRLERGPAPEQPER